MCVCVCMCVCECIYIYIYIVIHRQTASLYYNSSICLHMPDASSWDRNPHNFPLSQFGDLTEHWVRVFANGPGDLGSVPGRVIPKTKKMVLDASLLNTQNYKVRIKGKMEQSRERSSALPYTLV